MTNLEIIRQACIKANPKIRETKFGCRVQRYADKKIIDTIVKINCKPFNSQIEFYRQSENKIIILDDPILGMENWIFLGREIRLVDVLLALDINSTDKRWNISVSSNLIRIERLGIIEFSDVVCIWELKNDNLELQSEETIKFLADLLVMEGK